MIDSGTSMFNSILGQQSAGFFNEQDQLQMEGGWPQGRLSVPLQLSVALMFAVAEQSRKPSDVPVRVLRIPGER